MIRLFAPPTSDAVIRRNALTAGNLVFHVVLVALLAVPVGRAIQKGLLDNLVVYLVPPDQPEGLEHALGQSPVQVAASEAGRAPQGVAAETEAAQEDVIVSRGEVPMVSDAELEAASRPLPSDHAVTELEVDSAAVRDPASAAPDYPPWLLQKGIEGSAAVRYVVDTLGLVDTTTYRVITATHPDFAVAVRRALPDMRFRPAVQLGRRVRQLVQQTFRFRITQHDPIRALDTQKPSA